MFRVTYCVYCASKNSILYIQAIYSSCYNTQCRRNYCTCTCSTPTGNEFNFSYSNTELQEQLWEISSNIVKEWLSPELFEKYGSPLKATDATPMPLEDTTPTDPPVEATI